VGKLQDNLAALVNTAMLTAIDILQPHINLFDIAMRFKHIHQIASYCICQGIGQCKSSCLDMDTHFTLLSFNLENILDQPNSSEYSYFYKN